MSEPLFHEYQTFHSAIWSVTEEFSMDDPMPVDGVVAHYQSRAAHAAGEPAYVPYTLRWVAQLVEEAYPAGSHVEWVQLAEMLAPYSAQCE